MQRFTGKVFTPDHPEYDSVRTIFPGGFDLRPSLIVQPSDAQDVARVIAYARENELELAVRSGGHSPGFGSTDGGVVLDVRALKGLDIDVAARTAWAGSGLTAGEYTKAAAEHGLATGFGDTGSVGIGGITVAGGIGFLVRKHGLTIDNLLAAEVVTADGQILHVDDQSHPDLFWAIRGGGGNFGVVTRFKFQLHEVDETVGGMLMLPASAEVVARFMELCEAAPEELSAIVMVMSAPPMPFVPQEYHGKIVVMALMTYAGPAADGEQVLAPFRALATPIVDGLKPGRYVDMFAGPEDDSYHPTAVGDNLFVDRVDTVVAETIVKYLNDSDAPLRAAQLRVLGGAMARVPADATAFAHRASKIMVNLATFYVGADDKPRREAWVADFRKALQQNDTGAYVGFLADAAPERAYPTSTLERLREVKRRYDPDNVFRVNLNVTP
ncbi:FAD-binding oxidoreductase [Allorhizocola rhizosphaerae]|uniref:FAD-binding oxidoreductase n=1 Tax=Allorhizocola rhizosphaerae TaxID=1872709 RepID=UPI000E3CBC27|nr:FAD-binding oxidoreductase [Allorhizocola rhizosphaerae]